MFLQLFVSQLKVKSAHEYFGFGIAKLDTVLFVSLTNNVRVGLLNLLSTSCYYSLTSQIWLQTIYTNQTFLIVVSRLHINTFILYEMTRLLIAR